jgi:NAD(P)-dependent dehydrogenase (short-subunit alcohol dehydrogenase family)
VSAGETGIAGKVAIVTGAGAGLGRAEALSLAKAGASVVVNDLGDAATSVADEIEAQGGKALPVTGDVSDTACADALIRAATEHFGGLHVLVNNAGIVRDRMLFNMTDEEWDAVVGVHLRGHFLLSRNATAYWRRQSKAEGEPVYARVVNIASEAFLVGSEGQPNYAAAKAGIAALTVATACACGRYGVRANAICPRARAAMTEKVFGARSTSVEGGAQASDGVVDPLSPEHVAPFVAFLASPAADRITGQVFVVHGGMVALLNPPSVRQRFDTEHQMWTTTELAERVGGYFDGHDPNQMFSAPEILTLR